MYFLLVNIRFPLLIFTFRVNSLLVVVKLINFVESWDFFRLRITYLRDLWFLWLVYRTLNNWSLRNSFLKISLTFGIECLFDFILRGLQIFHEVIHNVNVIKLGLLSVSSFLVLLAVAYTFIILDRHSITLAYIFILLKVLSYFILL